MGPVWAVVVAAGSGTRFGGPKQFAPLAGRPLAEYAVDACRCVAERVVLVLPPSLARGGEPATHRADLVVGGGATRAASVRSGLAAVPASAEVVVVHDGARPLAPPELFSAVVGAVRRGAGAAVCAVPVTDTVKRVGPAVQGPPGAGPSAERMVLGTVDRRDLVAVQTPQAFDAELLRRVHRSEAEATDDAALVEALGVEVVVVPGAPHNLKVTDPVDLEVAEVLLARMAGTGSGVAR